LGRWVSALAAADFAALLAVGDRRVADAFDAALALVVLDVFDWARALAAADFAALLADFDPRVLPADDAAFDPVRSDFAMSLPLRSPYVDRTCGRLDASPVLPFRIVSYETLSTSPERTSRPDPSIT
jgi:hypothetical protein